MGSGSFIFLKCKEKLRPREAWLPSRTSFKKEKQGKRHNEISRVLTG